MEKMNETEALEKAYDSLIDTYKSLIDEETKKINAQLNTEALVKIDRDLKANGCNIGLKINETYHIPSLESHIEQYESIIKSLEESKSRLLK